MISRPGSILVPGLFLGALVLWGFWPALRTGPSDAPRTIVFYGFSILGDVIDHGVFPEFQRQWRRRTGERVELVSAFAGSGTVTNQIILGVPAQLALLSLDLDAYKLAEAGVIPPESWRRLPFGGVVNRTPFIILVRSGNPKGIRDFRDLAAAGVRIVHPDPLTSGGANWAIAAEYGAGARGAADPPRAGHDLLLGIWRNVVAQAASARAARTQFENGFGDALITYEQEALWDRARGRLKADVVYPRSTILSEHTLVRIDRNIPLRDLGLVDAFVRFLWTDDAQRIFVKYGFRSVTESLNDGNAAFGRIEDPFRIEDLGGWKRAKKEIVESIWKDRVLAEMKK